MITAALVVYVSMPRTLLVRSTSFPVIKSLFSTSNPTITGTSGTSLSLDLLPVTKLSVVLC